MMLDAIEQDSQSEKEVRKNFCPANLLTPARKNLSSRFSVDYWRDRLFRPTYQNNGATGEVQEWYAQIQFAGRREKVGLATNNKEEAARVAARFYSTLRGKGWEEALKQLSPDLNRTPKSPVTIGSFIEIVRPLLNVRPRTFEIYAYALRKITREAISIRDTNKSKYDPKSKGWRKTTDLLSLSKLTPNAVAQWKSKVLSEAAQDPVSQQRARRNINSFARCARALFSKKLLKKLAEQKILLPSPLPFDGFEMEPQGSTKYDSKVDARALLIKARTELADSSPEAWKVILLALGAGLRRAEIDGLCWGQVDFTRGEIRVVNHAFFQAKTLDSEGTIYVDSGLMSELKRFHVEDGSKPVVDSELMFRQPKTAALHYRCQETFKKVTTWLRANGVTGDRPLHTLRKEFGSIICAAADIHTASRQLRHSNLSTTAAYYADNRRRVTVPVLEMLKAPEPENKPAQETKVRRPKKSAA